MYTFPITPRPASVVKAPIFSTIIIGYGGDIEQRISMGSQERYTFELKFPAKETGLLDVFVKFFLDRKGSYEAFYFQNTAEAYRSTVWLGTQAYVVGDIVRPVTANGRSYICTIAGTSGGTSPSWGTTVNGNTTDSGVTWKENTYTVRFTEDSKRFSYFFKRLMEIGSISLITCTE